MSEYLEGAFQGGLCERFGGTGGASGQYGHQTPLDGLHRRGIFEPEVRDFQQSLASDFSGVEAFFERAPAPLTICGDLIR